MKVRVVREEVEETVKMKMTYRGVEEEERSLPTEIFPPPPVLPSATRDYAFANVRAPRPSIGRRNGVRNIRDK